MIKYIYFNPSMKPREKDIHGINTVKIQDIIPAHLKNLSLKNFPIIINIIPVDKSVIKRFKKSNSVASLNCNK
jgi:hypothetical protein